MSPVIKAEATDTVVKMEAATGRSFFGDDLECNYYYNGTLYTTTLSYSGVITGFRGINIDSNNIMDSQATVTSYDCIMYKGSSVVPFGSFGSVQDVFVNVPMYFSSYARGGFGMTSPADTYSPNIASNSRITYPDNYIGNIQAISANTQASASLADYYAVINTNDTVGYSYNWRPVLYEVNEPTYFDGVYFDNVNATYYGELFFCIWLPYVGGTMTDRPPVSETTTATSSSSSSGSTNTSVNVNVNVDVDMDETNGLLSQIKQGIDGLAAAIVDGLKDLFIPDEEFVEDWVDDLKDLLEDHLGGLYQAGEIFTDIFEEFENATASSTIEIPACSIPLAGETLTLGPYSVPLKVSGMPQILYDGIAWITDFLCLWAFLHMCRTKLEIFLVPESEAIKE